MKHKTIIFIDEVKMSYVIKLYTIISGFFYIITSKDETMNYFYE